MKRWLPALSLVAISLVTGGGCREGNSRSRSAAPRVLLIGIDGADLEIVDRLIREGRLPTFARLEREGAFGPLRSQEPLLSPIVWTTIATGRGAQDHGVLDFVEVGPDGKATPITSARRRVPALWNVASEFGKSSGFVGWYASYPAEPVDGFEVSDRLAFHQVKSARATEGATFPEKLAGTLRRDYGEPTPDPGRTRTRFVEGETGSLSPDGAHRLDELAKIFATSEFYRRIVPGLQAKYRAEILGVYFEGIDACGHLFMEDAPPRRADVSETDYRAFSATVDRYYEYQDEVLADLLKLEGPETVTIVVSDHGFKSGALRPQTSGRADTGIAPLWHRLHGVIFLHGRGVRPGLRLEGASIFDVAPTALSLLSIPLSLELPGRPISAAFEAGTPPAGKGSPGIVAAYRPVARRPTPAAVPADSEAVAKLMALGYISGAGKTLPHDPDGRTATSYVNEGLVRTQAHDWEGAVRAYGHASQLDPKSIGALAPAASIYVRLGNVSRARELLDRAAAIDPENYWVRIQRASLALATGDLPVAERELAAASARDANLPGVHLLGARLSRLKGDPRGALEELRRAESLSDSDSLLSEILLLRLDVEISLRDFSAADATVKRLSAYATPADLAEARGDLAFARHEGEEAERRFREALAANPHGSTVHRKLGETLGALGRTPESEAAFRAAIAEAKTDEEKESAYGDLAILYHRLAREPDCQRALRDGVEALPRSAVLWGMLGGALGRAGSLDEAIRAYETSVALKPSALGCKTLAALVMERRNDRPRAVALWRQSLALDPDQPDVRSFLRRYGSS